MSPRVYSRKRTNVDRAIASDPACGRALGTLGVRSLGRQREARSVLSFRASAPARRVIATLGSIAREGFEGFQRMQGDEAGETFDLAATRVARS